MNQFNCLGKFKFSLGYEFYFASSKVVLCEVSVNEIENDFNSEKLLLISFICSILRCE